MRVLLKGWYGHGNFGDDLLMSLLIRELSGENEVLVELGGASPASRRAMDLDLAEEVKSAGSVRFDLGVIGGGGLYFDTRSRRASKSLPESLLRLLANTLVRVNSRQLNKSPWIALGVGAGPFTSGSTREQTSLAELSLCEEVWFRDEWSCRWARHGGVRNVHEGADLGFLLDVERRTHSSGLALIVPRSPIVGARDADWVSEMKQAAHQAHTQGYRLVGVTLSETEAHSGLAYCGIPFDEVLHYRDLGLEGVLEQILSADLVISMRLHALLIGALGGALLQPVGTDPKLRRAIWDDEGPKRGAAPRLIESSVLSRKRAKAKESLASLFRQCST